MSTEIQKTSENKFPSIHDLYTEEIDYKKLDGFKAWINQDPFHKWVKEHPYIKQDGIDEMGRKIKVPYRYLPIDKVEWLLSNIFKFYRIEIKEQGTAFNGVYVVVRVHYLHPVTGEMSYHDGIGASQLQTKAGTSPSDLININNGALSMAFPMAKTLAVKDACDHFGRMFGSDLNRKDLAVIIQDEKLNKVSNYLELQLKQCKTLEDVDNFAIQNDGNIDIEILAKRKEEIRTQKEYAI